VHSNIVKYIVVINEALINDTKAGVKNSLIRNTILIDSMFMWMDGARIRTI